MLCCGCDGLERVSAAGFGAGDGALGTLVPMPAGSVDLAAVAARALGVPVRSASVTSVTPVAYDPFIAGRTVDRASGRAVTSSGETRAWTAIVKRTSGADLRAARRELVGYRLALGAGGPAAGAALRAPVLLASVDGPDHVELWLQEVVDEFAGAWPLGRFAIAATHIARLDVALRSVEWASLDVEHAWAAHHGQPWRVDDVTRELREMLGTRDGRAAAAAIGDPDLTRTAAVVASTADRIAWLGSLPQSLLHHDLVRSNLFATADGSTVAIDWELVGPGPLGVDLAPLVVGSVRRGEASADDLRVLETMVLDAYGAELRAAGIEADAVPEAYRRSLGLRWHVVLGVLRVLVDPAATRVRGSRPSEGRAESLHHMTILARHLLDADRD
jgi:hypothetical protein